jgi:ABC-type glycerol-3-phosphate transport system permease component
MSLIATIGRQTLEARLLIWGIYIVLLLGAVTMVYPFMVMVSGSFKTNVDRDTYDVLPAFVHDDLVLYQKHLECKHNNQTTLYAIATRDRIYDFNKVPFPEDYHPQRVADWREFEAKADIGPGEYVLGYTVHLGDRLELWKAREFRKQMMEECDGDIEEMNRRYDSTYETWLSVRTPEPLISQITERRFQLKEEPLSKRYYGEFKASQPAWFRVYPSLDSAFVYLYLSTIYGPEIDAYNQAHGTSHPDYDAVYLARTVPSNPTEREDWETYVRKELNLQFVRVTDEGHPAFVEFLEKRYAGDLDELNRRYGTEYPSFEAVEYPTDYLAAGDRLTNWGEFIVDASAELIYLTGPQFEFRDFLREKYDGDLARLNEAQGATYDSFEHVPIPAIELNYSEVLEHEGEIRRELLSANYRQVFDYVVMHGRSLLNTVIYCLLAITLSLTVNPLAAYALSRFNPPSTYKIILFCMATMAFPPAVTMIPNFLLLKELGLLNSFAALVLPAAANGFSIFLLKGFFDSLPRELYESASIDGAGEWTMFWNVTMALSKPILAVIALGAFTAAYGNFMFAFIVCPSQKMWTLMVFLYQLQIDGHQALTFAALLLAAIPTFLVFIFCQNIIIRGIVVPVEK